MKKEELLTSWRGIKEGLERDLAEKSEELKKGENVKSLKSTICGIKKNYELCCLLIGLVEKIEGENVSVSKEERELVERLSYNKKADWKEVSKKEVIEKDLIGVVEIRKVDGVNKYFIKV